MLIYNFLLYFILIIFSPFFLILYALNIGRTRERFALEDPDAIDSRQSILIHGASMGEMGVIRKILPELRKKYPHYPVIISSATLAGKNNIMATAYDSISHAICLPFEFRFSMKKMLRTANPKVLVVIETELWPNFIREAKKLGARVVLINGRLSEKSLPKYLFFKRFFKGVLGDFDAIGVQDREYHRRFLALGASPASLAVTGNIKNALTARTTDPAAKAALRRTLRIPPDARIWIAASTRPGEEELLLSAFLEIKEEFPDLFLILAPRHLNRLSEVESIFRSLRIPHYKRTSPAEAPEKNHAMILDTLGELSELFSLAEAAFIGGTLKDFGGHNLLEPLPFQVPVCFGPFYSTQKESAKLILGGGCGALVCNVPELAEFLRQILGDPLASQKMRGNIRQILGKSDLSLAANLSLI